ncbi:hypothetical protein WICMUC_004391 [Wickerhamomyces mucosus]|uniref:BHLH domain-containing protein n=1 Tax=Wickerhamomyces mucosus TaxID=1378264 RepID=A0A9P8PHW0_9ASCO|nr:hypothetical protein WICMUC_004391 [Wickerhamomyces mucosus]
MPERTLYSFDETDALLASLSSSSSSSSSIPTLSPSDFETYPSSDKSDTGFSPQEHLFQDEQWSNELDTFNTGNFSNNINNNNNSNNNNDLIGDEFLNFDSNDQFNQSIQTQPQFQFQTQPTIKNETFNNLSPSTAYISPSSDTSLNHSPLINNIDDKQSKIKSPNSNIETDDEDDNHLRKSNKLSKVQSNNNNNNNKVSKPKKDRSSHNVIEKKYRLNINSKIIELRDSVPSLRMAAGNTDTSINDLEGLVPASKINKASVLSKATEYIKHLENKNANLIKENNELKQLLGNFSPHQQQMFQPQQIQQVQIQPQSQQFQNLTSFQPATDFNGQPINIVSQHRSYDMGLPGKVLMGGLATMVGQNLFQGNAGDYDFRGLSGLPILGTPQFQLFLTVFKFFFVFISLVYLFVPSLFQSTSNSSNSKDKKQLNINFNTWYDLIKELTAIKVGTSSRKDSTDEEISIMINKELLTSTSTCSFISILFIFFKLHTYNPTFEVSFGKLVLAKLLLSYSDLSKFFSLSSSIENSLKEISESKVNSSHLRYFYKEFNSSSAKNSESYKRLLNLAIGLPINFNCTRGIDDKGYRLVLKDERVHFDYKSLLSSIRANELFREVLLSYIDLTFNKSRYSKLDHEELKEAKLDIWNNLSIAENLAPKRSIVDIRIKLFKSILNEKHLDTVLQIVDQESKVLIVNYKIQGAQKNSELGIKDSYQNFEKEIETKYSKEAEEEEAEEEAEEESGIYSNGDYNGDNYYELESELSENGSESTKIDSSYLDPKFEKLLSQDLFNALVSSSILKFVKQDQIDLSQKLLKYVKSNKNEITLLSFISMFKLVENLPKSWLLAKESQIIENILVQMRIWIGSTENLNFDDLKENSVQLKREISDRLVSVSKALIESGNNDV